MKININNSNNSPVSNPRIKELFAKRGSLTSKEQLVPLMNEMAEEIVLRAEFLTLIRLSEEPVLGENGIATMPKGAKISFPLVQAPDGTKFYPVFTDWVELMKMHKGSDTPKSLTLSFDDLAAMIVDERGAEGFVIDPFGGNLIVDRATVQRWREKKQIDATGHANHVIRKDTKVSFIPYKTVPGELCGALVNAAKGIKEISALWIRQVEMDGQRSHMAIVDHSGDRDTVFNALGEAAKPFLDNMALNMIDKSSALGKDATDGIIPLYQA